MINWLRSLRGSRLAIAFVSMAALSATSMMGCAYFNTFYNAREHFKKAERMTEARREREEEATGPTASAIKEYDLTIEKCNKVIQQHGDSRWVDDAVLLMGRAYFGKRQYTDALDKFRALVDGRPDSNLHEQAIFMMGLTYFHLNRHEEGRQAFDRLLVESPGFEQRDEILAVQARALATVGDNHGAVRFYRRILDEFPDSKTRVQTLFDIGDLYMSSAEFDSAYFVYDEAMRTAGKMEQRLEARRYGGDALYEEGRVQEALDTYRQILDLGTELEPDERAEVELKIALCTNDLDDHRGAIRAYERIDETYPGTIHAAEAAFQIGYIEEVYKGDYTKALEVYESVRSMGGQASRSAFATQADQRAQRLRRLAEIGITSAAVESSEGGEAEGEFLLAEHFFFEEGDTLKAYTQYVRVEDEYPESGFAPRAGYARAWLAEMNAGEADSTVSLFVDVLDRYPGTSQALQAGEYLTSRGLEELIPEGSLELREETPADSVVAGSIAAADSVAVGSIAVADSVAVGSIAVADSVSADTSTFAEDAIMDSSAAANRALEFGGGTLPGADGMSDTTRATGVEGASLPIGTGAVRVRDSLAVADTTVADTMAVHPRAVTDVPVEQPPVEDPLEEPDTTDVPQPEPETEEIQ